jgi:hypothetical protein
MYDQNHKKKPISSYFILIQSISSEIAKLVIKILHLYFNCKFGAEVQRQ